MESLATATPTPSLPFGVSDSVAYVIATIKECRKRFFPFLWRDLERDDLMAVARSLAWLILVEDRPHTRRDLWLATQRRLYAEAKSWGWHKERSQGMRYDQRIRVMASVEARPGQDSEPRPGALRRSIIVQLLDFLEPDEMAVLGGVVAELEEEEIAAELSLTAAVVRQKRRIVRRKLQQAQKEIKKNERD